DLLRAVREVVGSSVPVGAVLDPHAHLTRAMTDHATALVFFKEYPHVDVPERAADLFRLIADAAERKTRPHMAVYDPRMISIYHTTGEPMRGFVDAMIRREGRDGVLSISLVHGFPWGDTPDTGTKVLVITDDRPEAGATVAEELGRRLFGLRGRTYNQHLGVEAALDRALAMPRGPVVLADVADNAGGGAPGDST